MMHVDSTEKVADEEDHSIAVGFINTWTIFSANVKEHWNVEDKKDCDDNGAGVEPSWTFHSPENKN